MYKSMIFKYSGFKYDRLNKKHLWYNRARVCTCSLGGRSDEADVAEVARSCALGGFKYDSASTDR